MHKSFRFWHPDTWNSYNKQVSQTFISILLWNKQIKPQVLFKQKITGQMYEMLTLNDMGIFITDH